MRYINGKPPKVLILSAYYNHGDYIYKYVEALGDIYYPHDCIDLHIVCDGPGAEDIRNVKDIARDLQFNSGINVTYSLHEKNQGAYATFKELYKEAEESDARYVMILECDDYIEPDFLSKTVKFLEEDQEQVSFDQFNNLDARSKAYCAVHTDVTFRDVSGAILEKAHWKQNGRYDNSGGHTMDMPSGNIREELIKNNFIMTCAFLCTRRSFLKYNDLSYFESLALPMSDYPFVLSMSKDELIGYIDEPLSNYTVSPGGASNNPEKRAAFVEATLRLQQYARQGII